MSWAIQRKHTVTLTLAFLLTGIGVAFVYRNSQQRIEADARVAQTLLALNSLERTSSLCVDLETGMRGYVITGLNSYLEPYVEAQRQLPDALLRIEQLRAGDANQQARLSELERLIRGQMAFRAGVVRAMKEQGPEAGRRLAATGQGKAGMDAIRRLIGEMAEEERRLLRQRQQESASIDRDLTLALAGLAGLVGMILLGASLQIRHHLAERLRVEGALRASEEHLGVTLHSIGDGMLATDAEGRVTRLNLVAERLTGWSEAEARGRPVDEIFRIVNETTRQPAAVPVEKVLATGLVTGLANHTLLVARDGAECPIADSAAPIRDGDGNLLGVVLVFRDVTAEREAERALRASEERYRQVTESAPYALFIQSGGRFAYVNPAGLAMFGASRAEDIVGKPVLDFVHPLDRETVRERIRRINDERIPGAPLEERWIRLDGTAFWGEATANPTTYAGQPGAVVILQDISRRKAAEIEAAEHEAQLRTISANLPDGAVFQAVQDGDARRFTYISPGIEALTGLPAEDLLAQPGALWSLGIDGDGAGVEPAFRRSAEEMTPIDREMRIRTAAGAVRRLHWRAAPRRRSDGGIQWDGVVLDVTSRKQTEEELRRIEWLLSSKGEKPPSHERQAAAQPYGDLTSLNRSRLILDAVGADMLEEIVGDYLDLLGTSAAVYEKNGDYAHGIFSSGWCQLMDRASRDLCGAADNEQALACGKWLCHESCWTKASRVSIETGQPADIECEGGLRLYAAPIRAGGEIAGSINFGYGDPPRDLERLGELAAKYGVHVEELRQQAEAYQTRPRYIIELAKQRLETSARLIGEIVQRKQAQEGLRRLNEELEQRVAERTAELREAELRYRTILEETPTGVLIIDPETGLPIEFSGSAHQQLGYSREEFAQLRVGDYEVLESPDETRVRFEKILRHGRDDFETQLRTKAGEIRNMLVTVKKIELAGRPAFHGVFRDITERKRMEEALRESEERFRLLVNHVTEYALIGLDPEGNVVSWNEGAERIEGYTSGQIMGRNMTCFYTPEDAAAGKPGRLLGLAREQGTARDEGWRVRQDGSRYWAETVLTAQRDERGQLRGFSTVTCDRTERKAAEDRLRAEHRRLTEAQRIGQLGDWEHDMETGLDRWSDQVYDLFGVPQDKQPVRLEDFVARLHPEDLPRFEQAYRDILSTGAPFTFDHRIIRPDGGIRWISSQGFLETDENGKPVRLYGTNQDVTERILAQSELRASEDKFRRIVETATEGIWIIDADNRTMYANRQLSKMLGWSVEEMMGRNLFGFMDEQAQREAEQNLERRRQGVAEQHDFRFRTRDGKECWAIVSTSPLCDEHGEYAGALGMVNDITERRHLEDQLRQTQKMEAIGRLAGGVAHDFNNLLTVINGYAGLLLAGLDARDPLHENAGEIKKAGERAAELTQQLLAFSRKQMIDPKVLDLNHVVHDVERMLRRVLGEDIELATVLQPDLGRIKVDSGQIIQVLMNLAVNAREAMPDGGHLLIETADVDLDEPYAKEHVDLAAGAYVRLTVSDSGVGMDAATQARIFEPFFTSKKDGKGTGLGLATVYGIVKHAGGAIYVYSEVGHGTIFKIYLPRVEEVIGEAEAANDTVKTLRGRETILVVEDQPELRALVQVVLKSHGYNVLEAGNAGEAMLEAERHAGPIHLLLTDVVMPNMSGRELAERLRPFRPAMKVLYMSGYTGDVIAHRGVLDEGVHYLQKPFGPEMLARKVREVLGPAVPVGRILVADDEAGVRSVLRQILQGAGYEVVEAEDGKQVVQQAAATHLDLVITDLVMPEQEGVETIQVLRKRHPGIKIIAMSGAFDGEFLKVARMMGAAATLEKPIRPEQLLKTVRELLPEA